MPSETRSPLPATPEPRFSVVVPCYNEEDAIAPTLQEIFAAVGDAACEVIVVNDGSTDGTAEALARWQRDVGDPRLRVRTHCQNRGYGAAVKTGFVAARAPWLVMTDADGTYPNERICEFVELAEQRESTMLVGARVGDNVVYSKLRSVPKFFLRRWAQWLTGQPIPDMNSGFRVIRRESALQWIRYLPDGFSLTTTILIALMLNHGQVDFEPIAYAPRVGQSKIKPIRDTLRFMQLILRTGLYFAPLKTFLPISGFLGCLTLGSFVYDIFVIENLADTSVLLFLFTLNSLMFAMLADMIDRRNSVSR